MGKVATSSPDGLGLNPARILRYNNLLLTTSTNLFFGKHVSTEFPGLNGRDNWEKFSYNLNLPIGNKQLIKDSNLKK